MTKKIPLQNGMLAIVDAQDYERCMKHTWYVNVSGGTSMVVLTNTGATNMMLSRFIMNESRKDVVVSFYNGNKLDFRKSNLRVGDRSYGSQSRKANRGSSSKYKGVSWDKSRKRWLSCIQVNGKNVYIGRFKCEEEAAIAYNVAAAKYFGNLSYKNIIGESNITETYVVKSQGWRGRVNPSGYKGVKKHWDKWAAYIYINKKTKSIGLFETSKQAAKAYDKEAYELHGDKAILNFPELIKEYK